MDKNNNRKRMGSFLSGLVLLGSVTLSAHATLPHEDGYVTGNGVLPIVDEQGRQLILQGLNSGKGKHSYMRRSWETEADIEHQAKNLGYNTHRYLIFWDHVMPERGVINHEYLDDVEARLQWFTDNNMKVILDMHQDNWGEQCDGNGAPGWASTGTADPAPGAPWWIVAASPCVVQSQLRFYDSSTGLQDEFTKAWKAVAERFAGHPAVIGYDLFNEPTEPNAIVDQMIMEMVTDSDKSLLNFAVLTTIWIDGHPYNAFSGLIKDTIRNLAASQNISVPESYIEEIGHVLIARNKGDWGKLNAVREFEGGSLSNLYQKTINAIRTVDNDSYIFVEPMSISANHGFGTALRMFNDPRSGERRLGYIPHLYPRDLHEGTPYKETDWSRVTLWERNQKEYAYRNNMAWVMGEFGNSPSAEGGVNYLKNVVRMAERNHLGWEYWDSSPGGWGPIASDNVSDSANAAALVNIYPRAVSGRIENYQFDRENGTFTLTYRNTTATGATEIAVPARFAQYGLEVISTDETGLWSYSHDSDAGIVYVDHNPEQQWHTITVKPNTDTQAIVYSDLKLKNSSICLDFVGTLPSQDKSATVYKCSNVQWQQWGYDVANQFIRSNQNPEFCLSHGSAAQAVDGQAITIATCTDSDDHRWVIQGDSLRNLYNTELALTANGRDNGSKLSLKAYQAGSNQQWTWAWRGDKSSMLATVESIENGKAYSFYLYTLIGGCGMEWDGNLQSNNERNAKFDCAGTADQVIFHPSSDVRINPSTGARSVTGHLYSNGCGLEWDGHLQNNNERNAKWDCSGTADPITISSSSGGAGIVIESHGCGLEWDAKLNNNNERNAKFDCSETFDELLIRQFTPVNQIRSLSQLPDAQQR